MTLRIVIFSILAFLFFPVQEACIRQAGMPVLLFILRRLIQPGYSFWQGSAAQKMFRERGVDLKGLSWGKRR